MHYHYLIKNETVEVFRLSFRVAYKHSSCPLVQPKNENERILSTQIVSPQAEKINATATNRLLSEAWISVLQIVLRSTAVVSVTVPLGTSLGLDEQNLGRQPITGLSQADRNQAPTSIRLVTICYYCLVAEYEASPMKFSLIYRTGAMLDLFDASKGDCPCSWARTTHARGPVFVL